MHTFKWSANPSRSTKICMLLLHFKWRYNIYANVLFGTDKNSIAWFPWHKINWWQWQWRWLNERHFSWNLQILLNFVSISFCLFYFCIRHKLMNCIQMHLYRMKYGQPENMNFCWKIKLLIPDVFFFWVEFPWKRNL